MKKLIVIIGSLLLLEQSVAQQPDLVFHHLTQKDGLSYNIINCFLKDSRGMMWIGTYNGLNRYDGAHFFVFRKGKDKNSLPNNTVHKLAEDKKGNIWGATDDGIFCYDQQKNIFKSYQTPGKKDWPVIPAVLCDQQGTIWACNGSGLVRFNAAADSFEIAAQRSSDKKISKGFLCRKNGMAESPDGKGFWLACREGLLYYNKALQTYTSSSNNSDTVLFAPKGASAICATGFGQFRYFDNVNKRLVGFDPLSKKVTFSLSPAAFADIGAVATIFEDNNHLIWMCTWNYELFTIDYRNGNKITRVMHNKNDRSSIAGDFFWAALQEKDGTLWLGTVGGISRCNPDKLFYKIHHFNDSLFTQPNPAVNYITENKNDATWWIGSSKEKLIRYNPATLQINSYDLTSITPNKKGAKPRDITRMVFLKEKIMLFSSNGCWIKDANTVFRPFNLSSIPDTIILKEGAILNDSAVYFTDHKRIWNWNPLTNKVSELTYLQPFSIKGDPPLMFKLTPVNNNTIWMQNGYDFMSYTEGDHLVPIKYAASNEEAGTGYYTTMAADKEGNLWIAKKAVGLFCYRPAQKKTTQYNQFDGLVMDHIMAVTPDHSGKVWTAAYNQFSVLNPEQNSFYNFTLPLSANNFAYVNFMTTLSNGNIVCNIAGEIVEFFPEKLKAYTVNTKPLISTYSVAGTEKLLPQNNSISLSANDNNILLKFGLLADNEASPYDMLYIMEGLEKNRTVSGSNFEASYNNLPPGNYTFKVKASAKDKSWETGETVLQIHIATPFYKSWWFILLLAAIVATAVYLFYRYRLSRQREVMQLETKAQLLEKEKTTVMYESLKQQLNPHFLFNSLTSLSGLIESDQQEANDFLEQMSGIYRYILKSGDNEAVPLHDEVKFVKQYITLQQTRFKRGLQVYVNIPEEYLHYKIAPVTLQNLIENAIKHNIIDNESPLIIDIFIEGEYLFVKNNLQKKNVVETSNKKGLVQFAALYKYLSAKPVLIEETSTDFTIKIPLL